MRFLGETQPRLELTARVSYPKHEGLKTTRVKNMHRLM